MRRILAVVYGVASDLVFLAAFLYAVGFAVNLLVSKSVDSGMGVPPGYAVLVDSVLLALLIALQFEEWDPERSHGERYRAYRRQEACCCRSRGGKNAGGNPADRTRTASQFADPWR